MKLKDFVETFVEHNSIVRLVSKISGGHEIVGKDWNDVLMANRVSQSQYADNEVKSICSILCTGTAYIEAINIVIKL
jgi:hypothetical protein